MSILHRANHRYCSQAFCTVIEKLTYPKLPIIGQMAQSSDGNKYTYLETCQLLDTAPSGRAISYLSDFQELARLKLMEKN